MATKWIAGWNTPGYLPDSDEGPPEFDSWREASDYIHDELHEAIDLYETDHGNFSAETLRSVGESLLQASEGEPWTAQGGGQAYWIEPAT